MSFAPTCTLETWKERQRLLVLVRSFFESRNVLEVETPVLSHACGTDPHLDYFETKGTQPRYLMTSPEFHMKRLLAAKFGDIFQIAKAFRVDEMGVRHNSEFTLVEWYRVGMSMEDLIVEVEALCSKVLNRTVKAKRTRWKDAFTEYAGIDPFCDESEKWRECCAKNHVPDVQGSAQFTLEDWWDYVMVSVIEPHLGLNGPEILMDYPPSQAALSKTSLDADGLCWAKRFELYIENMELCNGYEELTDAQEQAERFQKDLMLRTTLGKSHPNLDEHFLEALQRGMPAASGVAVGLDRLLMIALNKKQISDVVLFPDEIA